MRSCAFPNALLAIQTTIWRLVLHPKAIRSQISIQRTAGWELQNLIVQILFIPVWKTWNEQNLEHVENMQSCFCTYHRVCYKDKPCPKFNPTFARSGRREYRFSRPTAHGTSEQHFAIRMWRFPNLSAVSTSRENVRSCKNKLN